MRKPLVWLHGEVRTPPFSEKARIETGVFLRKLQRGEALGMPNSRPMPTISASCHELRIVDGAVRWRLIYRIDADAIVIAAAFKKKTAQTPKSIADVCTQRYRDYDRLTRG